MPIVSNTVGSSGSQIQLTCLAEGYPRISSIVWRRSSLQVQQFTMVDAYTWTASTSLVVGVDCTQTYQCVATSTEQSLPSPVQNSSACPSCESLFLFINFFTAIPKGEEVWWCYAEQ